MCQSIKLNTCYLTPIQSPLAFSVNNKTPETILVSNILVSNTISYNFRLTITTLFREVNITNIYLLHCNSQYAINSYKMLEI